MPLAREGAADGDGPVVGFRSAGGEENLLRADMQQLCQHKTAVLQELPGLRACAVDGTGVAKSFRSNGMDMAENLRPERGRGGIVKVDHEYLPVLCIV